LIEEMTDWAARPLDAIYAAIYIDAIVVKVRDEQVANRPFYAATGVTLAGERDILGLWAGAGGHMPAYQQTVGIVRPGGIISRVGVPQYEDAPIGFGSHFGGNVRPAGGPAPARAYIEELMPDIVDGTIEPGKVFDATTDIDGIPNGYQDMDDRKSLKVYVKP
jgi:threonine dehydrogenase-like Zn-dependent dehydrogenase